MHNRKRPEWSSEARRTAATAIGAPPRVGERATVAEAIVVRARIAVRASRGASGAWLFWSIAGPVGTGEIPARVGSLRIVAAS